MDITRYDAIEAARVAHEPRYVRRVRAALYAQVAPAIEAAALGAPPAVCAALVQAAPLREALEELYQRVGLAFAKAEYRALTRQRKAVAPPVVVSRWLSRLKRFLSTEAPARLQGLVDTTRKLVTQTLDEAATLGLGAKEAAARLSARVDELTPARALTIARTEILAGSNFGSLLGAEATGIDLLKVWISTLDGRARESHVAANGQAVDMKADFTVGGCHAKYPGDPKGPASELVRCRCAIGYKPRPSGSEQ